jgi:hypothetical protein
MQNPAATAATAIPAMQKISISLKNKKYGSRLNKHNLFINTLRPAPLYIR